MNVTSIMLSVPAMVCLAIQCLAVVPTAEEMRGRSLWLEDLFGGRMVTSPCSFICNGRDSSQLLPKWKLTSSRHTFSNRVVHTLIRTDPQSSLALRCEVTEFRDHPTVEWVAYLKNTGASDTPILADIRALDTVIASPNGDGLLHYARGALCSMDDFAPLTEAMRPGVRVHLEPAASHLENLNQLITAIDESRP